MSADTWFWVVAYLGVYFAGLLLLDGAHKAHIKDIKRTHAQQVSGLHSYIRTLYRERQWLENELVKTRDKLAKNDKAAAGTVSIVSPPAPGAPWARLGDEPTWDPVHIQWLEGGEPEQ